MFGCLTLKLSDLEEWAFFNLIVEVRHPGKKQEGMADPDLIEELNTIRSLSGSNPSVRICSVVGLVFSYPRLLLFQSPLYLTAVCRCSRDILSGETRTASGRSCNFLCISRWLASRSQTRSRSNSGKGVDLVRDRQVKLLWWMCGEKSRIDVQGLALSYISKCQAQQKP